MTKIAAVASLLVSTVLLSTMAFADDTSSNAGLDKRVPWTTSRITGSPEPPLPYISERVFPSLKFTNCLDLIKMPGSDRLLVIEQAGKIFSFPNRPDVEAVDLVADLGKEIEGVQQVYSLAFHPNFEQNRYCYVCYIKAGGLEDGSHIARFTMPDTDPPTIDVAAETTIITWPSGGHNGCCIKFGLDGYLYISTGDGTPPNPPDGLKAGQDVTNLLSAILRIDVDHADDGKNYRIPPDNPFVDLAGARGEIWAYGFRNPWRISIDQKTGDLWVGDVGWELWEMLDRAERGGNYGWAVMEGPQSTNPEWPRGPTPILPPTIAHPHSESSSITDGLTYYGTRLPELSGHHVYSDYDTGKFWAFRFEDNTVKDHREIADTTHRVAGFGDDHAGEFYFLDHVDGTILRLVPNPQQDNSATFPRKLSETGLFRSVADHEPAAGVVAYSINAEPWEDFSVAERFVAVPDGLSIDARVPMATPPGSLIPSWAFPTNTVLVKTISLEMQQGNADRLRRLETQILHFDGIDWQPYTYVWNDDQSDAVLLDAAGDERIFEVVDADAPNGIRQQTWRFSSRSECMRCHNKWSGPPLAFNTAQLNKAHIYGNTPSPQLESLAHVNLLDPPVPMETRPQLANPRDPSADLDGRARAYLNVNCAHCHRMHAGSSVLSKMHYDLPLAETTMVGVRPTQGTFGIPDAQVIAPGDPFRSVLLYRISKFGGGRMPHIGSTEVDREALVLFYDWIKQIPPETAEDKSGTELAFRIREEENQGVKQLLAAKGEGERTELVDRLLSSTTGALLLQRAVDHRSLAAETTALIVETAAKHGEVSIRDLFERYLPAERRVKRLGSVVKPEEILSLPGDVERGKRVFFDTAGVQCKNCHQIAKEGKEVGPELTTIAKKNDPAQLLESLLQPSKRIDPKFVTYLAETTEGLQYTGLLISKTEDEVLLRDAQNKDIRIPVPQIEELVPQQQSLMPELLLRDMTAQQVADLLAYLSSLK